MKRIVGSTIAGAAMCCLALVACGGGTAAAPGSSAPAPSAATSSVEPAADSVTPAPATKAEKEKAFVANVRAKVASGDYVPTKESSKKSRQNIKKYMAALTDGRLAAVGTYNCQIKDEIAKSGVRFTRRDFEKLELKNTGLEEGFTPLLGLTWDEALKTICPTE